MAKHLVLGNGNLGVDLGIELLRRGEQVLIDHSKPANLEAIVKTRPDVLWCAVGGGGPSEDPESYQRHLEAHVTLPWNLANAFSDSNTRIVFFSTHYLNDDPEGLRSKYASTKADMEKLLLKFARVHVFRIGSLYGTRFPLKTLPGKVVERYLARKEIKRAINVVTPTPTRWLAEALVENKFWEDRFSYGKAVSIGPSGMCSIDQWINEILMDLSGLTKVDHRLSNTFTDPSYPVMSNSGVPFASNWEDLWHAHGPEVVAAAFNAIEPSGSASESVPNYRQSPGLKQV